jgi:hypothetical protein
MPILGYAQSDNGLLRAESEGFTINAEGFNIKRSGLGSVAGQSPVAVIVSHSNWRLPNRM